MAEIRGQIENLTFTIDRKSILSFRLSGDFRKQYDELKDKDLDIIVKPHRDKRSLNANSYAWTLINQLAEKLNLEPVEVYRQYILKSGIQKQIEIREDAAETFKTAWGMHGIGWLCEKVDYANTDGFVILNAYYGSSVYNTKQMSRLIDNIVQDCKAQGIQVLSDAELDLLKREWHP